MNCPNDIADILLQILGRGVIYARAAGWSGDAERAALEADHVHNLSDVLATGANDKLWYYFHLERPAYESQIERWPQADNFQVDTLSTFRFLWKLLEPFVPQERPPRRGKSLDQMADEFLAERNAEESGL